MLFAFLSGFKFLSTRVEGDVSDQLHYYMTSNLLIALAILVSWKQFGGRPIEWVLFIYLSLSRLKPKLKLKPKP
jgi:hypothetical protein